MVLKHMLHFPARTHLEAEEIAGHSNSRDSVRRTTSGLEEDEITWFSNSKRCSECCTVGLADVKLHGFKPDFFDVPMDFRFGKV